MECVEKGCVLLRPPEDKSPGHEHPPERDVFPGLLTTRNETIQETRDETWGLNFGDVWNITLTTVWEELGIAQLSFFMTE